MIKILAIEKDEDGGNFSGFLEMGDFYVSFYTDGDTVALGHHCPKAEYNDHAHFVGVMSKFDPHMFFLKKPIEISDLRVSELRKKII